MILIAALAAIQLLPLKFTRAQTQSVLTVTSQDTTGSTFSGMYTVLYSSSGSVLSTSFTPANFTLTSGQNYVVQVDDYGKCSFSHWGDTGSTINPRSITISSDTQITAVYNCGGVNSSSNVAVNSVDQNGNTISGYYTVLYDSSGLVVATGFTPETFSTTAGSAYAVGASSYGTCTFNKWSDGVVSDPRSFTATSGALSFTAIYNCGTTTTTSTTSTSYSTTTSTTTTTSSSGGTSTLTVNTQLNAGGTMTGFYTVLLQNGNVVATGFSPAQFTVTNGQTYSVEIQNYGTYYFQYWQDTGSVNANRLVTISASLSLTAILCNGPPGTCAEPTPTNGITVYVHRIPASYWTPCFALACSAGTGPGASMYVALLDSSGKVVQSGFANEQGYTFTGLTPGTTYYVYPADCDNCHNSTHDVLFTYWGNNSTVRPLPATVGSSLDAWYSCTNNCV